MKFKKLPLKKAQKLKAAATSKKIREASIVDEQALRKALEDCTDVVFSSLQFQQHTVTLVYCTGLVSNDMLYRTIPSRLDEFFRHHSEGLDEHSYLSFNFPNLKTINNVEHAVDDIFYGKLLLLFKRSSQIYSVDISDRPQRKTEEGSMEISVKGPRDNFIEDVSVNYALIQKRLRTTSLRSENFVVGKRTKTKVSLLYIKDIANPDIIEQIRTKIEAIDIDGLTSGMELEGLISDNPYSLFPQHTYTGRPDFAVQSLLKGRFVILIDGVAYAYMAPVNLFFLLKTAEDNETHYFYNAFQRLMRAFGLSVAAFLPGFWVALTSFHQNQLPFTLLATVIESRRGVPFPTSLEALLMLLLFEVFREAGLRLPLAIGQTLSVIGGLIIGDAAIRAGLTSPAMLVVIAASTIATFTLVNQTLVGFVSLLRFAIIILSSALGFFGFFVSVFLVGTYVANIQSFNVSYLQIAERLSLRNALKAILRVPEQKDDTRLSSIQSADPTKQGGKP